MALVIALALAIATVGFVALPFFLPAAQAAGSGSRRDERGEDLRELQTEKEVVYSAIEELDFDARSGKLSDEDHAALRQRHEERAALLLQRIDALEGARGKTEAPRKTRKEKRKA
jgi:hypothetical protein